MVVVGTRPEAIKMAPVMRALRRRGLATTLVSTSQHRELLQQALHAFGLEPDVDLGLMRANQTPADFAARCLRAMHRLLVGDPPAAVLVEGDTTSVVASAQAAAYAKVFVGHVEAGLRSGDPTEPFPEELNRRLAAVLANLHFAPTARARDNLLAEGVAERNVVVTGNTIVDALAMLPHDGPFDSAALRAVPLGGRRVVLATVHRRENQGRRLAAICAALREIVSRFPDVVLVLPTHPNPNVREPVLGALDGMERVHVVDPLSYRDALRMQARAALVLTDSGGIQEEAPSFGVPVLVLREVTERPELIEAGGGQLTGTRPAQIVRAASRLLADESARLAMRCAANPFGDGLAAERIVDALVARLAPATTRSPMISVRRCQAV